MPPMTSLLEMPAACESSDSWTCAVLFNWTGNEDLARASADLIGKPLTVLWLVLLGFIGRWLANKVIDRIVARARSGVLPNRFGRLPLLETAPDSEGADRRAQRAETLGSLLKSIVNGVIVTVVLMTALAELGVNIAPLIASAGIVGVALGFGAQSLVKDFLSGIFMIMEDQYGVGDTVTFGDVTGTIEAVSLRITRMRDVDGTVWYLRNGEILRVGNQSQNWSRTVLDIAVSYQEDIGRVRSLLRDVAHELAEDPAFREKVLEEPEVWGVQSLGPDSVVVRVTLKTQPQQQWIVARAMRERIKQRFDEEGVSTPLPQRVIYPDPPRPT